MKFETKFGLGEICALKQVEREERVSHVRDHFWKVIMVTINVNGEITYTCRSDTGQMVGFFEEELEGDPDYMEPTKP